MVEQLRQFLEAHPTHHEAVERWPVQGALAVRLGLADELPPAGVTSSILAIVVDATRRRVLYLWPGATGGSIAHVLIGGRAEGAETPEQAVVREVAEETGWVVEPVGVVGFRHFHHLEPRVGSTDRPYPDFVQAVYAARPVAHDPTRVIAADRIEAAWLDVDEAERRIEPAQRPLLRAAVTAVYG